MAFENLFLRIKRSIGGIQLDGIITEGHDNTVQVTDNPVESGKRTTDHAVVLPKIVEIFAVVTDTPLGAAAFAQIIDDVTGLFGTSTSSNSTRTQQAYNALIALQDAREPISVVTKLKVYNNMLITRITLEQDKDTSNAIFLRISLKEIIFTASEIVELTEDQLKGNTKKQASSSVKSGTKQPTQVAETRKQSVLFKIGELF